MFCMLLHGPALPAPRGLPGSQGSGKQRPMVEGTRLFSGNLPCRKPMSGPTETGGISSSLSSQGPRGTGSGSLKNLGYPGMWEHGGEAE